MSDDNEHINALFGSESDAEEHVAPSSAPSLAPLDVFQQAGLEDSEEERPGDADDFKLDEDDDDIAGPQRPKLDPETWEAPLTSRPRQQLQCVNFKSLLDIESHPFNAEKFDLDGIASTDDMGRRRVKASELNKIRWRWTGNVDPDTNVLERESNARFVRWSDGSLQLHIGDDVLDVSEQDISNQNLTLCVFHSGCKLLQAQAQVNTRFLVKPHGLNSRLHRNIAHNLSPVKKQPKVKINNVIMDYERQGVLLAQQEEARLKLEKRQDKVMKRSSRNYASVYSAAKSRRAGGMTAEALEAHDSDYDDDEDGTEYNAGGVAREADDLEDEERARRLMAAKRDAPRTGDTARKRKFLDDDDDDFDVQLSDDDEVAAQPSKQVKKRFVIEDEDDESD